MILSEHFHLDRIFNLIKSVINTRIESLERSRIDRDPT